MISNIFLPLKPDPADRVYDFKPPDSVYLVFLNERLTVQIAIHMRRSFFTSALIAGLVAGALDIIAACVQAWLKTETAPIHVLRSVASGAVDPKTFSSPVLLALLGLLIHFFIAISFAFLFFFMAKQIPSLVKYPLLIGIVYGLFVWATMRFIILPYISRLKLKPIEGSEAIKNAAIAAAIIVVFVGIPIALLAKRYVRRNR